LQPFDLQAAFSIFNFLSLIKKRRIANSALQNRPISPPKTPFSAIENSKFPQAENQTPHTEIAIPACGV
jgi:hypothetical protein